MSHTERRISFRTCIICRKKRQRIELVRIVRKSDGQVMFDKAGRMDGRGAYVCGDVNHLVMSGSSASIDTLGRGKLNNALRTNLDETTVKLLGEAIATHLIEKQSEQGN